MLCVTLPPILPATCDTTAPALLQLLLYLYRPLEISIIRYRILIIGSFHPSRALLCPRSAEEIHLLPIFEL